MLGCYRKGDVADEDVFTRAVIAVLCDYPEAIVRRVTDPAKGLPATLQWLPTIAEVKAACEREYAPIVRQRATEYRRLMQQRERLAPPEVTQEARERAVARWKRIRETLGTDAGKDEPTEIVKALVANDLPRAAELARASWTPVQASPELRALLARDLPPEPSEAGEAA